MLRCFNRVGPFLFPLIKYAAVPKRFATNRFGWVGAWQMRVPKMVVGLKVANLDNK